VVVLSHIVAKPPIAMAIAIKMRYSLALSKFKTTL